MKIIFMKVLIILFMCHVKNIVNDGETMFEFSIPNCFYHVGQLETSNWKGATIFQQSLEKCIHVKLIRFYAIYYIRIILFTNNIFRAFTYSLTYTGNIIYRMKFFIQISRARENSNDRLEIIQMIIIFNNHN